MPHDYGTGVYAMSMAATAAFNYMSSRVGASGFQASCADLDILKRIRNIKGGFMVLKYADLLYPQYNNDEHFPPRHSLITKNKKWLKAEAKKLLLKDNEYTDKAVIAHWKKLAA